MADLAELREIRAVQVWPDIKARRVQGDRITLAVVELAPNSVVPEHRHDHEQVGVVLEGSVRFTVGDDSREFGPGGTWRIRSQVPHRVQAGPDGAVVVDTFSPVREDWNALDLLEGDAPAWPVQRTKGKCL